MKRSSSPPLRANDEGPSPVRAGGSLRDVSRLAGVSIATASRVITGSPHPVSEAARARVLQAAEQIGYSPSRLGRALVTQRSQIIGVVVGDIVDPYFAEITRGVEDIAARAGFMTIVCNADRRTESELAQLQLLTDYQAAGVVFAGSGQSRDPLSDQLADAVASARDRGMRVVALATRNFRSPKIRCDNRAAAREITAYLLSLGHRRIALITGPARLLTSRERQRGFAEAMRAAGVDASLIHRGDFGYDGGFVAMEAMVAAGDLPDAVLGANDATAIGALGALRRAGITVPDQISIAGVTDTCLARYSDVTTVRLPIYELGASAARLIVSDEQVAPSDVVLAHEVVPRSTTARRGGKSARSRSRPKRAVRGSQTRG